MKKRESHNLRTPKEKDTTEVMKQGTLIHRLLFNCDSKHNTIKQYRHLWKKHCLSPNIQEMILIESGYEKVSDAEWKLKDK